jgi:hypothetical protein
MRWIARSMSYRLTAGMMAAGMLAAVMLAAVMLAAGCSAGAPASYRASVGTCYAFGVQAIRRHVTVTAEPRACAGLSHEQINLAVARALREAVGAEPKAAARHLADQYSGYLVHMLATVRPPGPVPPAAVSAPPSSSGLPLGLAALAVWLVTAAAGAYLLAGWLAADGRRRRRIRPTSVVPAAVLGHFGLALAGLGIWVAFLVTGLAALAWVAVGLVVLIAGLGMGVLGAALPEPARSPEPARNPAPAGPGRRVSRAGTPVIVIAIHGMLATATILLVLLAAIGAG